MALVLPAKRPRELSHRHQASVDAIAPRSKRTRVSIEPSVGPSEASFSEDDEADALADETLPVPSQADEDEDEDAKWDRATQAVQNRATKNTENTPAECGVIEQIGCKNFMCHERLTVTLGPLINFIIGHNGSGKSAVLTALTLCLGGKAAATNRGQSLKSFIKQGKESSTISVRIKNRGVGAYKHDQYGDSIVVERHFTLNGSSGFKLKDQNEKTVSTKKSELEDIIDHFGMHIDNPLNVLTQDMARQFLNDSNAKEKYKFFLKGTQLETLDRDYVHIEQELNEQKAKGDTLQHDVRELGKKYHDLLKKTQEARHLEALRDREKTLQDQAAWAYVTASEKEAAEMEDEISNTADLIQQQQAEADQVSENFARADQNLHDATIAVETCKSELQPALDAKKDAQVEFETARTKVVDGKHNERNVTGALDRTRTRIGDTQSQINDHKQRRAQADGGLHAQKVSELEQAKVTFEERKADWENHDEALPDLNKALQDAKENMKRSTALLETKKKEEAECGYRIRNLERGQHKWTDAYETAPGMSQKLEALLRAIENERGFREKPVGPLGRYVEVKKPRWSWILEKNFGNVLSGFAVTSPADQRILHDLMVKHQLRLPNYLCTKKDRIDTSGHEPEEDLLTIDRVLNIKNDLVRNTLLTNNAIEQIVLIQNRAEASVFAHRTGTERSKNVKAVLCWSDGSHKIGHSFVTTSGSTSMNPIVEWKAPLRMQADKGHQIQDSKDNLVTIQQEKSGLQQGFKAAQDLLKACDANIRKHKAAKQSLQQQMNRAQEDVDRLDGEVAASVPDTAQLEELEKELADLEEQRKLNEDQYEDLQSDMQDANNKLKDRQKILTDATTLVEGLEAKLEKCKTKVHRLGQQREQILRQKNQAIEAVQAAEESNDELQRKRDELQINLDVQIETALKVCPRVEVPLNATFDSLMRDRAKAQKRRADLEKELGGSQHELTVKANAAKTAYEDANVFFKNVNRLRDSLANALMNRKDRWLRFRADISINARAYFGYLLSHRQFRGTLQLDHNHKALSMEVNPKGDEHSNGAKQQTTKSLSGGEKSFSTICLLLSLWDSMGSPIRCLDEFDVFMDNINRDISMGMIIEAARRSVGRQYIFITPQAMNNKNVKTMDDVKVIKMSDPDRGQTALNFSR